jgi:hypothetical protein
LGNMAGKQGFLVCPPWGNMARKQCFLICPPLGIWPGNNVLSTFGKHGWETMFPGFSRIELYVQ